jgi:hypothetical protein
MPYNQYGDSPDGTGRNTGVFWYQGAVKLADIRDGSSQTASFSERCLGVTAHADPLLPGRRRGRVLPGRRPEHDPALHRPLRVVGRPLGRRQRDLHPLSPHPPPAGAELPAGGTGGQRQPERRVGDEPPPRRGQPAAGRRLGAVRPGDGGRCGLASPPLDRRWRGGRSGRVLGGCTRNPSPLVGATLDPPDIRRTTLLVHPLRRFLSCRNVRQGLERDGGSR